MMEVNKSRQPEKFFLSDNGTFPNSTFPVLLYRGVLTIPGIFPAGHMKRLFLSNNWYNAWKAGIFTFDHYHSNTHEVMGVIKGETTILLGGYGGLVISLVKGDVLIIPAGVAHKNLGKENDIACIGAYPDGRMYDMNYGEPEERPAADRNISSVPLPGTDPVMGIGKGPAVLWR